MILGKVVGKVTTTRFTFLVTHKQTQKFAFIQLQHPDYGFVLCQILELVRTQEETIAQCNVIGYKDENNRLQSIRTPFAIGSEVLSAEDEFIKSIIELNSQSAYIGTLQGRSIPIHIDLQKLLTKHISILAKSGAGKSYTVGVLIEEILEKGVPILIIDPHGEYSSLKFPTEQSQENLAHWNITAKGYAPQIKEYGDPTSCKDLTPIKLTESMNSYELMKWLPLSLSSTQEGLLFSVLKDVDPITFDNIAIGLEQLNSQHKWALLDMIRHMKGLELFSQNPTPLQELISSQKCSILNLKGMEPNVQSMVVGKLLYDLFLARKRGKIPPFFCIIEEAHNFVPEKGFGSAKSSHVIRLISSEGRKFGVGLCVVSQRPALVQKTVLAQCSSQIIMKITNPNDLRMIGNSVEGITQESLEEIQHLPVGSALVCGVVDRPLVVNIRERRTKHGGVAVQMIEEEENIVEQATKESLLALIKPKLSIKEIQLIADREITKITTYLIPALFVECEKNGTRFNVLIDRMKGDILLDPENDSTAPLETISPNSAFFKEVAYEDIAYDVKLEETISEDELKKRLISLVQVKNSIPCYVVYHKTEF